MKSPPKGSAESLTSAADWFTVTQQVLLAAKNGRDEAKLRRGSLRIDSPRFKELPNDAQEDLLELYGAALMACGAFAP